MDIDVYSEIKREDHPFYQKGSIHCFSFVTKEGRNFYGDVLLTIGQLYKFHIKTNHPFYIGTKESGSLSDDAYGALKIQGNFGTNEGGTLFFRPTLRQRVLSFCFPSRPNMPSAVFRLMAGHPKLDILVVYCSLQGAEAGVDPEFGIEIKCDRPLMEGVPWVSVPNRSHTPGLKRFFGLVKSPDCGS